MSLAQTFGAKKIDQSVVLAMASDVALKIRSVCSPQSLFLFGSGAENLFMEGSDLDFLLVFSDQQSLVEGRKRIRTLRHLCGDVPVDLIFVTAIHFDSRKDLGGVCFIAFNQGVAL